MEWGKEWLAFKPAAESFTRPLVFECCDGHGGETVAVVVYRR
jgi:hypothetical protein